MTLSGANTFTSGLTIKAGTVAGNTSNNAFGANGNVITIGDSTGSANATLKGAGTYANPITVASGSSGNTLSISNYGFGANATFNGATTLNNDLTLDYGGSGYVLTMSGGITGTGNIIITGSSGYVILSGTSINNTGTITNSGTGVGTITISAVIGTNVTGVIQNSATSQLTLSGVNTFTSGLTIKAGTVALTTSTSAGGGSGTGTITIGDTSGSTAATLKGDGRTFANPIVLATGTTGTLTIQPSATSATFSGGVTGTNNLTLNGSSTFTLTLSTASINNTGTVTNLNAGTGTVTISAVIGTNVTGVVQNSATSQLTLSGVNTFTSGLTIKAGTVALTTSTSAGGGSGTGTITIGDTSGSTAATLKGDGRTFANPIVLATGTTGTLTIQPSATSATFSGGVTGTNNLTLNGSSTFTLTLSTASINNTGTVTNLNAGTGTITISSVIGTNVTGVVQNSATSALALLGNNSTVGAVTITAGTLEISGTTIIDFKHTYPGNTLAFTQSAQVGDVIVLFGEAYNLTTHMTATDNLGNTYTEQKFIASVSTGITSLTAPVTTAGIPNITTNSITDLGVTGWIVRGLSSATAHQAYSKSNNTDNPLTVSATTTVDSSLFFAYGNESTNNYTSFTSSVATVDNYDTGHFDAHGHTLNVAAGTYTPGVNLSALSGSTAIIALYLPNSSSGMNINISGDFSNSGTFTANTSTVTLTTGTHTITGANTFNNLTLNPSNTVTFPASTTQTISGAFSCAGTAGNVITINSSSAGTKATLSDASGTNSCSYMSITDSSATGGAVWSASNSTGSNYDGWTGLNVAPNAPTLVSPANASYTTDTTPTLSANYSDNDAGDTGTTNYRISSSSLADCTNNTNVIAWGTSSATSTNNESTTWTNASSIGADAAYYWCAQNNDGVDTSSWTQMGSFTLDTTAPTTTDNFTNNNTWVSSNQTITLTPADATSGVSWTKYCADTTNTCTVSSGTSYTVAVTISTEGTSYFRYASQDNAGNTQTTVSKTVKIDTTVPITTVSNINSNNTITSTLTCTDTSGSGCSATYYCTDTTNTCTPTTLYTIPVVYSISDATYIRYYSIDFIPNTNSTGSARIELRAGGGGPNVSTSWPQPPTPPGPTPQPTEPVQPTIIEQIAKTPQQIAEQLQQIATQATNIGKQIAILFGAEKSLPGINYPSIAEAVPKEAPDVFRGGVIVSKTQLEKIAILPLPKSIKNLALKFPQFGTTLEKTGITKPENVKNLRVAKLTFPGLTEASGATANLPLKKFTTKEISQIPTDFVFARLGKDNIDLKTKITFSNKGEPIQTINTIENKPLYLVVKPEVAAKSVKGYIIFKSANSQSAFLDFVNKLSAVLSASLLEATNLKAVPNQATSTEEVKATKDIVLSEFSYEEDKSTGVWQATIQSPAVSGKYEIRTKINYLTAIDKEQKTQEASMIMVVDPEGYVYKKDGNDETRIANAAVSIYWLNPSPGSGQAPKYELWPAKDFQQQNPQITNVTGRYSFLVPSGDYYIEVVSQDYLTYQGQPFQVTEGSGVHLNIELKTKNWFFRLFSVERIILALIAILLFAIIIILLYFLRRTKNVTAVKI